MPLHARLLLDSAWLLPAAVLVKVSPHDLPDCLTPSSPSASSFLAGCYPLGNGTRAGVPLPAVSPWRLALLLLESPPDLRGFPVRSPDEVLVLWFEPWTPVLRRTTAASTNQSTARSTECLCCYPRRVLPPTPDTSFVVYHNVGRQRGYLYLWAGLNGVC